MKKIEIVYENKPEDNFDFLVEDKHISKIVDILCNGILRGRKVLVKDEVRSHDEPKSPTFTEVLRQHGPARVIPKDFFSTWTHKTIHPYEVISKSSAFPIKVVYTDNNQETILDSPADIVSGRSFKVLETNVVTPEVIAKQKEKDLKEIESWANSLKIFKTNYIILYAGSVTDSELSLVTAFMKWQRRTFTVKEDIKRVMELTKGKPEVIIVKNGRDEDEILIGFNALYKDFVDNGLMLCY